MGHEVGENDVLKKLERNGSQEHGSVVVRQMFVPLFEDRCYVSSLLAVGQCRLNAGRYKSVPLPVQYMYVAHSFKTWLGMLSGPNALATLIFCRNFSTPRLSILKARS